MKTVVLLSIMRCVRMTSACLAVYATAVFLTPVSIARADETSTEQSVDGKQASSEKPYQPKSDVQLRRSLSKIQYYVTQEEGTEKAFRNLYWNNKKEGAYNCVVCDQPLFSSNTKYKSGTGWPSFFAPLKKDLVGYRKDWKLFYARTEVHCKRCHAHLGHVFDDGPKPTGKRYCMNSASLKFVEQKKDSKDQPAAKKDDE